MLPMSLGMAATILVGQYLGEKAPNKAKQVSYAALIVGLNLTLFTALLTILLREQIAMIFVKNVDVIAMAGSLLILAALYQFSDTVQVISSGVLRGYKDTQAILFITLFCYWIIGMPLGYTLAMTDFIVPHLGAQGFWIGFVASLTTAAFLLIYRMINLQKQTDEILLAKLEKKQ